ncbi:2-oxoglutarate dehydrogenase complex dihydrolipoyllysine-residue succinyltransferase [Halobacillus karajensis]|uniref:Dihydrolipoyllysine-residue succinyltransferase component of 2-oxoglutarate dehydrogenase complex n=1 Tax=Halobacillus karajensis TaxID=195088 RepID=A0A024P7Y2_9BACI|nr:2-oxoglutarate dehydrogenase complex dihydrolipoyllysine-residue succinyltransferase [Halobacillus karajensis]CDQ21195.1 Dihydrolipoyllysine-residue succinyltransferase component of 2-oxoglutarate dehydrogenase complex [Halobacillus karajensis]CDQ24741.1 Dihydrolipoyllysine-residue succinyltransferase component of 2-oxoglutarate dehydrogenase complex [Halobacillus karajensis]CDQ28899.1 Dihydrolipoyllysine-residue succinyltransferase component of 2-oxoglutarate dehydrogenase complex [Halobacil
MKEIKVPELAESITEGTIAEWLVKKGDQVEKGDPILELETDKVNVEVNADASGVIAELLKDEGEDVEVGDVIAQVDENGEGGGSEEETSSKNEEPESNGKEEKQESSGDEKKEDAAGKDSKEVIATPAARKRARELGIDLSEVSARDPLGRIRPEDVDVAAEGGKKQETTSSSKSSSEDKPKKQEKKKEEAKKTEFDKPVERVKMSRRRQTIAKRLVEAQQESAMLTTFNEVDMTNVMKLRSDRKESFQKKHDIKLGFMSFFTKAAVGALKEFSLLNAEIQGNEIIKKQFYDIGMAVSTDEGLVVPVVRDADRLDFAGIEKGIADLATKARNKELGLEDLQGGSFTITNGGIFGSMLSTPILNAPQVGILGLHNIEKRAKVMPDDTIEARPMMYIALSYDHRIVDGKEAVQFLRRIKEMIEDPYDLLLEG